MNTVAAYNDIELHMIIDDDLRLMHGFSVDEDYSDYDEMNTVRVSIAADTETIAYMECFIFYENKIDNLEIYADGVTQDAHEAMYTLKKMDFWNLLTQTTALLRICLILSTAV